MTSSTHQQLRGRLSAEVLEDIEAVPPVRADVVARAQAHLRGAGPCPAEKIAAELVDCLVGRRLP
jgi:hypothetical protein